MAKEKAVSENTIVFNNLLNTLGELNDFWEVPASESWHNFFFNTSYINFHGYFFFLLNISGQDKPGLTSSLTAVLAEYDAKILDIGQANIHNTLSLGILFQIKSGKKSAAVLKDLLFKSYELGIKKPSLHL